MTSLNNSIATLVAAASGSSPADTDPGAPNRETRPTYVRSGALFEQVKADLRHDAPAEPRMLALRDLVMIDGALASLAPTLGVAVTGLDTGDEAPTTVRNHRS